MKLLIDTKLNSKNINFQFRPNLILLPTIITKINLEMCPCESPTNFCDLLFLTILHTMKNILWKYIPLISLILTEYRLKSNFDACYVIIKFEDFSATGSQILLNTYKHL